MIQFILLSYFGIYKFNFSYYIAIILVYNVSSGLGLVNRFYGSVIWFPPRRLTG